MQTNIQPEERERINALLNQWREGKREAFDEIISLLHSDLRRIAHWQVRDERVGHTLQTDDLISKLYIKLLGSKHIPFTDYAHFLRSTARAMRQILIDHARAWIRRADGKDKVAMEGVAHHLPSHGDVDLTQLLTLHETIVIMEKLDPDMARIADMRLTLGLTLEETSRELKLPINKVKREWLMIRKFLGQAMGGDTSQ